jgi:hypothetical protein
MTTSDLTLDIDLTRDYTALYALAMVLPAAMPGNEKAHANALTALENLRDAPAFVFDGSELRVISASRRSEGVWQVTDGETCTCEGRNRASCWHRRAFALLSALEALRDAVGLRRAIIAQAVPPVVAPTLRIVALPDDEITDAAYADLLAA